MKWRILILTAVVLSSCAKDKKEETPYIFLPRAVTAEGVDLEAAHSTLCKGTVISLDENFLTPANFRSVFDCANYDKTLAPLEPLLTNKEFPSFISNINVILRSESTAGLKETINSWLKEGPEGTSRADRLLPLLAEIIKNPSFQDGLPLLSSILTAGESVWDQLLPGLAEVVYQERFPDNYEDISELLSASGTSTGEKNYAKTTKDWAKFLGRDIDGKTVAYRGLELVDGLRSIHLSNTSLLEYLDQLNEKGVFVSLFLESGAVRGEKLSDKLNADPDEDELKSGELLSPEERRIKAYKKLFARGPNGENAPIVELVAILNEFQKSHPDFLPALSRWFSANGGKLSEGLSEYVLRARILSGLPDLSVAGYLNDYAESKEIDAQDMVNGDEFAKFLADAFHDGAFVAWLNPALLEVNRAQLGPKNGNLVASSGLAPAVAELYSQPAVANFAHAVIAEGKSISLSSAIRKYSNLHRGEKLVFDYHGGTKTLEQHLLTVWADTTKEVLGENVVLDFGLQLAQTLFSDMAANFGKKNMTITEWYYSSPYSDPSTFETILGYGMKDLGLMEKYYKHRSYLENDLPNEIFKDETDKVAFRKLVHEVPGIWLYFKSGMARSGNDLTRAMASKDKGYLIKNYVSLLCQAFQNGLIEKGVAVLSAYQNAFPESFQNSEVSDALEDRRKVSLGADALKRVMRSLFRPQLAGNYETSTSGRLVHAAGDLVSDSQRSVTERFLLTSADQVLATSDAKLNNFFRDFGKNSKEGSVLERRQTMKAVSETLRDGKFPTMVRQLNTFFQDNAVKPALDYLARRIDDGSLPKALLFLRRILGFKS